MTNTYKERRKQRQKLSEPVKPNIDTTKARYLMVWNFRARNCIIYVWRNALGNVIRTKGYQYMSNA